MKDPPLHDLPASVGDWSFKSSLDKQIVNPAPSNEPEERKQRRKIPALRKASWNAGTMRTGMTEDLQSGDNARKTDVIDMELERLNLNISRTAGD